MDVNGKMAEAAETDLFYPISLVWDAWDIAGDQPISREKWANCLKAAISTYEDDPVFYEINPAIRVDHEESDIIA